MVPVTKFDKKVKVECEFMKSLSNDSIDSCATAAVGDIYALADCNVQVQDDTSQSRQSVNSDGSLFSASASAALSDLEHEKRFSAITRELQMQQNLEQDADQNLKARRKTQSQTQVLDEQGQQQGHREAEHEDESAEQSEDESTISECESISEHSEFEGGNVDLLTKNQNDNDYGSTSIAGGGAAAVFVAESGDVDHAHAHDNTEAYPQPQNFANNKKKTQFSNCVSVWVIAVTVGIVMAGSIVAVVLCCCGYLCHANTHSNVDTPFATGKPQDSPEGDAIDSTIVTSTTTNRAGLNHDRESTKNTLQNSNDYNNPQSRNPSKKSSKSTDSDNIQKQKQNTFNKVAGIQNGVANDAGGQQTQQIDKSAENEDVNQNREQVTGNVTVVTDKNSDKNKQGPGGRTSTKTTSISNKKKKGKGKKGSEKQTQQVVNNVEQKQNLNQNHTKGTKKRKVQSQSTVPRSFKKVNQKLQSQRLLAQEQHNISKIGVKNSLKSGKNDYQSNSKEQLNDANSDAATKHSDLSDSSGHKIKSKAVNKAMINQKTTTVDEAELQKQLDKHFFLKIDHSFKHNVIVEEDSNDGEEYTQPISSKAIAKEKSLIILSDVKVDKNGARQKLGGALESLDSLDLVIKALIQKYETQFKADSESGSHSVQVCMENSFKIWQKMEQAKEHIMKGKQFGDLEEMRGEFADAIFEHYGQTFEHNLLKRLVQLKKTKGKIWTNIQIQIFDREIIVQQTKMHEQFKIQEQLYKLNAGEEVDQEYQGMKKQDLINLAQQMQNQDQFSPSELKKLFQQAEKMLVSMDEEEKSSIQSENINVFNLYVGNSVIRMEFQYVIQLEKNL